MRNTLIAASLALGCALAVASASDRAEAAQHCKEEMMGQASSAGFVGAVRRARGDWEKNVRNHIGSKYVEFRKALFVSSH